MLTVCTDMWQPYISAVANYFPTAKHCFDNFHLVGYLNKAVAKVRRSNVKGINLVTAFYHTQSATSSEALRVPVSFDCVRKTIHFVDAKTGKQKRRSPVSKNEMMRSMLQTAVEKQHLKFGYVLADSWFSASDNMLFIHRLKKFAHSTTKCNFITFV